jgi:hypothetical protein
VKPFLKHLPSIAAAGALSAALIQVLGLWSLLGRNYKGNAG